MPSRPAVVLTTLLCLTRVSHLDAQPSACGGRPACAEVTAFVASVADVRLSTAGRFRLIAFTVRFRNKTDRPLRLGYVRGSGLVLDDRGNRYVVGDASNVRAIGEITGSTFDPKFALAPGESSDARFEMAWAPQHGDLFGTAFEGEVTVREIDPVPGGQWRIGREHVLRFPSLGAAAGASAIAGSGAPAPTPPAAFPVNPMPGPAVPDAGDACAGRARCYATGPFTAEVTSVVPSTAGRHRVMRVELQLRNVSGAPLVLGYKSGSGSIVDESGNRFYWGRAGSHDQSAQGIGLVSGQQADPQFVLRPGEARRAAFTLMRFDAASQPLGTAFSYDLALTQLEVLPGSQVRAVRDFAVSFPGLTVGVTAPTPANAVEALQQGRALLDRLRGRVRKP